MLPGEVKTCAHCEGQGICKRGPLSYSCKACVVKAGLSPESPYDIHVICSACGGKGSVWVGPEVVQIVERKQ